MSSIDPYWTLAAPVGLLGIGLVATIVAWALPAIAVLVTAPPARRGEYTRMLIGWLLRTLVVLWLVLLVDTFAMVAVIRHNGWGAGHVSAASLGWLVGFVLSVVAATWWIANRMLISAPRSPHALDFAFVWSIILLGAGIGSVVFRLVEGDVASNLLLAIIGLGLPAVLAIAAVVAPIRIAYLCIAYDGGPVDPWVRLEGLKERDQPNRPGTSPE